MNLTRVRELVKRGAIELDLSLPHALTEARKDGLTTDDLEAAVTLGEVIEDYGERVLLFHSMPDYQIPFHIVLEFLAGDDRATVVTAYVPDPNLWEADWKTRKKAKDKKHRQ